jgi:hypothetical protein
MKVGYCKNFAGTGKQAGSPVNHMMPAKQNPQQYKCRLNQE